MRFLWFTDVHLSDTPPSMRKEGYTEEILAKLEEIAQLAESNGVDYCVAGGDWFHSKLAARVSHGLVNSLLNVLDKFPCPILSIVGSHDVPYGRLDLMYKRPIGTVLRHPKVRYLSEPVVFHDDSGVDIRFMPVSDVYNNTEEEVIIALKAMQGDGYRIALLHQPVVKQGSFPYPVIQATELVGLANLVLYGHMHTDDGVYTYEVGSLKTTFGNCGAVSRGSIDEDTLERKPQVLVFEINGLKLTITPVELKSAKSSADVFKLAEYSVKKERESDIEALLQSVRETQFGMFSTEAAIAKIRSMPVDDPLDGAHFDAVKTVAVELLEAL